LIVLSEALRPAIAKLPVPLKLKPIFIIYVNIAKKKREEILTWQKG